MSITAVSQATTSSDRAARRSRRRRARLRNLALVVASLAVGGAVAGLLGLRYLGILEDARELRTHVGRMSQGLSGVGLDLDRNELMRFTQELQTADDQLSALAGVVRRDPLLAIARRAPFVGELVGSVDGVVGAASKLVDAGQTGLVIAERYVEIREAHAQAGGSSPLPSMVELMVRSRADVRDIARDLNSASGLLSEITVILPGPLGDAHSLMLDKINEYGPLLAAYTAMDGVVPEVLGWNEQRRYLVLAQNPAELRPTGGFIGTYGVVTFDQGALVGHEFHDVYLLDRLPDLAYVEPPAPLRDHLLGSNSWELADSNWSPDFPTAAQAALAQYTRESGDGNIDGVIAITTFTIDELLEVMGPVEVPEYDETVRAGQTTFKGLKHTRRSPEAGVNRKEFLDIFAGHLLDRIKALPSDKWPQLIRRLETFGIERHAMVWFKDEAAQDLAASAGWDGAVRQDEGDYLFAVDANVAPATKLNLAVQRKLSAQVRLDELGNAEWDLEISWTNVVRSRTGELYDWLLAYQDRDTYGNFVRILTPARSRLLSLSGGSFVQLTTPELAETEAGRQVYGNYLMVPPGAAKIRYRWISPYAATVDGQGNGEYRLVVQKQPGSQNETISLKIDLPDGAYVIEPDDSLTVAGNVVHVEAELDRDLVLAIRYRQSTSALEN